MIEVMVMYIVFDELLSFEVVVDVVIFLDMDLGVLGVEEEVFDEYEGVVRKEYGYVDE